MERIGISPSWISKLLIFFLYFFLIFSLFFLFFLLFSDFLIYKWIFYLFLVANGVLKALKIVSNPCLKFLTVGSCLDRSDQPKNHRLSPYLYRIWYQPLDQSPVRIWVVNQCTGSPIHSWEECWPLDRASNWFWTVGWRSKNQLSQFSHRQLIRTVGSLLTIGSCSCCGPPPIDMGWSFLSCPIACLAWFQLSDRAKANRPPWAASWTA